MRSRIVRNRARRVSSAAGTVTPSVIPEWLNNVRTKLESEPLEKQTFMMRAINAVVSNFDDLSDASVVRATAAPSDLLVLVTALSSGEILEELKSLEPLAPAFLRGIHAQRRLLNEHGGTLTAEQVGKILGISRQSVDKRRQAQTLLALNTGRHGYRYPAWQFTNTGTVLVGLRDTLQALSPHDEWMQAAFFVTENPRLGNRTPLEVLKSGKVSEVLRAAQVYGEHGAA